MYRIAVVSVFMLCALILRAQKKDSSGFTDPLVLTGQFSARNASDAFELIKVISREEIDLMHAVTLNDVLMFELNINQLYTGKDGYRIDYQGFGSRNMLILKDGVPILPFSADFLDIGQISLQHVERIELIYGAGGVRLGNAAVSITVNLISMRNEDGFLSGSVRTWAGAPGVLHASGSGYLNYGRHHAQLAIGRNFQDGVSSLDFERQETFKPTEQFHARLNYYYKIGQHLEAGIYTGMFLQDLLDRGEPDPGTTRAFDEVVRTYRYNAGFYLRQHLSKIHTIDLQFSHAALYKNLEYRLIDLSSLEHWTISRNNPLDSLNFGQSNASLILKKWDSTSKFNYQAGANLNIQRDRKAGDAGLENKSIPQYELFASAEYRPDRQFWLSGGLRTLYSPRFGTPLIPEIKMRARLSPNFDLLASYSGAYRIPSFNELYYNYTDPNLSIEGNLNLKAEKAYSINTGFDLHFKRLRITTNFFTNDKQNVIHLLRIDSSSNTYAFLNSGRIRTFGTQAMVSGQFGRFRFQTEATSTGVNSAADVLDQYYFYQQLKASLFVSFFNGRLVLASINKFTSNNQDLRLNNDGIFEAFELDQYFMSDLSASVRPPNKDYALRLGLKNIFNVRTVQGAQFIVDFNSEPVINNYLSGAIARGRGIFVQLEGYW